MKNYTAEIKFSSSISPEILESLLSDIIEDTEDLQLSGIQIVASNPRTVEVTTASLFQETI